MATGKTRGSKFEVRGSILVLL